jgi:uncharacterized protein
MESTRVRLRVSPGAARAGVVGRHGEGWKIRVAAAPEGGRANEAVIRLLADTLSVPRDAVTLVSGHAGRDKIVELAGLGPAQIERRLTSAAGRKVADVSALDTTLRVLVTPNRRRALESGNARVCYEECHERR